MKKASYNGGSSGTGKTIFTTPRKLIKLAESLNADYSDYNSGEDKTNFDFEFEDSNGCYITVYDWKYYRPLGLDERVDFNIGSGGDGDVYSAIIELERDLRNID